MGPLTALGLVARERVGKFELQRMEVVVLAQVGGALRLGQFFGFRVGPLLDAFEVLLGQASRFESSTSSKTLASRLGASSRSSQRKVASAKCSP